MCIDLLNPQNAKKKTKTHFQILEFPAKTRLSVVRNMTVMTSFSPSDSWYQDIEFSSDKTENKNCYNYFDFHSFMSLLHS